MASVVYTSYVYDSLVGDIDSDTDTFYMMLLDNTFVPNRDTQLKRSDVEADEITGASGYTAGGKAVTVSVTKGTGQVDVDFADVTWANATIDAAFCVIYKRRGGASTLDELVCAGDFGGDVQSTNSDFTVQTNTPIVFNLPA